MKNSTTKNKKKWEETNKRFVAFLDIMGFKDMVMRMDHEDLYKTLNSIFKLSSIIESLDILKDSICITKFSDSIIIFSNTTSKKDLQYFIKTIIIIFSESLNNHIPLKGAIAYGKISIDKDNSMFFGQPIIDAHLLQEELFYYGVICHNSFENYLRNNNNTKIKDLFLKKPTALKSGNITHLNLDWYNKMPEKMSEKFKKNSLTELLDSISLNVSGAPRKYIDNTLDMNKRFTEKDKK